MAFVIHKNIDSLSEMAAVWIIKQVKSALNHAPQFSLALSGGSTPKKLYQSLASNKYKRKIDWKKIHFFWGDERCVPFEDERNNARMAFINLINHVPVLPENVHVIRTDLSPTESALQYEKLLRQYFPSGESTFDLALLGLGQDAHTLSIFPGSNLVFEKKHWVRSVYNEKDNMDRITLTPPIMNAAKKVAFLVSGKEKAAALQKVRSAEYDPLHYPAQSIRPLNGALYWFADNDATKAL